MKNYTNYKTEDFVQDHYFRKWALGKLAPEDSFWVTWQDAHSEQFEDIEQARNMVIAFQCEEFVTDPVEVRTAIDAILTESKRYRLQSLYQNRVFKIAASLLLIAGLSVWYLHWGGANATEMAATDVEVNDGSLPRTIRLSDSSIVTLFPKSELRIAADFGKARREVFLTGEAFFHVARNTEKPFYVYAGEVVTKVLGTSFNVKAFTSDEKVSIAVRKGKVTVFKQDLNGNAPTGLSGEIILVPNQQAVFEKKSERLIKTLVENPIVLEEQELAEVLEFSDTPIPQVLHKLEHAYGVKIVFDEQLLENCNFTASLTNEPLFEKLHMICETIQARYELVDGQVVIYARKCN
ncbi:FecR family protein [Dyadobacter sp. CY323]|uniref:FecR family protein n=1 Tax=Dyadobacter sp. CY323 TaxID=2907302 RepID=UPI001F48F2D1|nr:FecR family protein [Dyadobacter sp. CY323]MCE6991188.1 FecR domain-containing protein [Dyadobacter sp. CY323]